jgi:hypothetical protein
MNPEQPGQPDPDLTIRHRWPQQGPPPHAPQPAQGTPPPYRNPPPGTGPAHRPRPGGPPPQGPRPGTGPLQAPHPHPAPAQRPQHPQDDPPGGFTRRLPYTPDMLPDVPVYETKPARSGWWWMILVCGVALVAAALTIGFLFWVNSGRA